MASAVRVNMFRRLEHLNSDAAVWVVMRDWIFTILFVWWHLISNERVDDRAVECSSSINNFHYASLITGSQSFFFSLWSSAFEFTHLVLPSNEPDRLNGEWSGRSMVTVRLWFAPSCAIYSLGEKNPLFKCQTVTQTSPSDLIYASHSR